MFKRLLKITFIIISCVYISKVYGKDYGKINKMVVTASTISQGSVDMAYNLEIILSDKLEGEIDTFEIPMLSEYFSCIYYTKLINSIEKNEDSIIITTKEKYGAGEKFTLAFIIRYSKFYKLNSKNEAVYNFRFDKIKGFYTKEAKLRWSINNNIYANYNTKDDTYRYWDLKHLGLLSKKVVVKYDANLYEFPKENAKKGSVKEFMLGGGAFLLIFLAVLITNIIPNDSYKKNSGFGFNVKMKSID